MNFKSIISIFALLVVSACGVKSDPKVPANTVIPSYESTFMTPADQGTPAKSKEE